jgi:hypothetical protein
VFSKDSDVRSRKVILQNTQQQPQRQRNLNRKAGTARATPKTGTKLVKAASVTVRVSTAILTSAPV